MVVLLSSAFGRIRPAACFALYVCHIANVCATLQLCVPCCSMYVRYCSMQHNEDDCDVILHFSPATSSTPDAANASLPQFKDAFCPEADFLSAVSETAPQFVAMHDCCQQVKCIAKGRRCETHRQGRASWVDTACISAGEALFALSGWCMLTQAVRLRFLQAQSWVMLRGAKLCCSNCCRNLAANPGLCNAIPNITALSSSSFANSALDFPACNASVLAAQAASNTSPASPSSFSASPASSPSPEAGSAPGAGSYHTSPGINVSVSVLVGLCFLLGLLAGCVRIRQQQRRHRVSQQLCHSGLFSGMQLSLS